MAEYKKYLKTNGVVTESYEMSYAKGKDEWYDVEKDGRKILKKAMADVKKALKTAGSNIYDGGKRYQFSQYDDFTLGYKEEKVGSRNFSMVVMTTDGDGEIFVKDTKAMLAAIKKIQSKG